MLLRAGDVHLAFQLDLLFVLDQVMVRYAELAEEGYLTLYGVYHFARRVLPL